MKIPRIVKHEPVPCVNFLKVQTMRKDYEKTGHILRGRQTREQMIASQRFCELLIEKWGREQAKAKTAYEKSLYSFWIGRIRRRIGKYIAAPAYQIKVVEYNTESISICNK
jgi:hypothetical protein